MRIYQRPGSPYWWVAASIRGRRFRRSTGCTGRRQAEQIAAELIAAEQRRAVEGERAHGAWRLRDVTGAYWDEIGRWKRSEAEIFKYFCTLNDIIGQDRLVRDIDTAAILEYRARRRGRDGCSAVTINRDLAMLRAALNHAHAAHGQPLPPISWKRVMVRENPHRIRFASADEFSRLLEHAHPGLRPILIMAVTTGLRRANILGLQWHQVDMGAGIITVPRTKSGRPHIVRMAGPLRGALATLQPDEQLRRGAVFDITNWRRRWMQAKSDADIADLRFHDLRHTFASWARQAGTDIADLKDAMDHSSIAVTMRYAHINPATQITAFDRVAALLGGDDAAASDDKLTQSGAQSPNFRRKSGK